jgi:hypothetical protein
MLEYFATDGAADEGMEAAPLDSAAISAWLRDAADAVEPVGAAEDEVGQLRDWATHGS